MKNTILSLIALTLSSAAASAQDLSLDSVRLEAQPVASGLRLPAFEGLRSEQKPEILTQRLIAWSGCEEPLLGVSLTPLMKGSKLAFQGRFDTSIVMQFEPTTGDISFQADPAGIDEPADTPGLPMGQDAVRQALQHLQGLGLLPEDPRQLVVRHIGGERMAHFDGETTQDFAKVTMVHFGRRLGGFDVGGPGSKIVVGLGENGRLVSLIRRWQELDLVQGSAERMLPAEKIGTLTQLDLARTHNKAMKVDAGRPELGFYDDGKGRIEPAWFTKAKVAHDPEVHEFARSGEVLDALSVIPALEGSRLDTVQQRDAEVLPSAPDATGPASSDDE
jgi:hypothetical protein